MKKVICINMKGLGNRHFAGPIPKEGDILTVSWEGYSDDIYSYCFAEYEQRFEYSAWRFAPLDSDLDETELVTEEFEEKYCVPVKSNV